MYVRPFKRKLHIEMSCTLVFFHLSDKTTIISRSISTANSCRQDNHQTPPPTPSQPAPYVRQRLEGSQVLFLHPFGVPVHGEILEHLLVERVEVLKGGTRSGSLLQLPLLGNKK